jgi:NADP-dependent 3-hydroxy acid dehydrogenase YdfG
VIISLCIGKIEGQNMNFTKKVALITGAGTGIGETIAGKAL